ncbi:hypothetical protein [Stigmatella aurantiaca]|uniref:hypothetical protein n=1 Tax=Stigmatella aurantiaca TaxID=41 RepID=UPI000674D4F4|nr:hypothetical protein [Stigmatella aurantiaca]
MAAKKTASRRRRTGGRVPANPYTHPALRERLKKRIQAGSKGGRAGQWSARKSQLLAAEYKKAGGGYRGPRGAPQKSLEFWTKEAWQTRTGATRARRGKTTSRYLPKKAWAQLSEGQKRATDRRKQAGSRRGKQFVSNTSAAKRARKSTVG